MKRLVALLCFTLTVCVVSSPCVTANEDYFYELNSYSHPAPESRSLIDFRWIMERYDFDSVEEYIDEYYINYYKSWERYLTSKQREIAGKFGLSDIFFKPNFSRYENTKLVLSKRLWGNRLLLRYLAPVGDMGDFELFLALKPSPLITFVARGRVSGGGSVAIVINRPFGRSKNRNAELKTIRLLEKARQFLDL